jgi:hypothetical protein
MADRLPRLTRAKPAALPGFRLTERDIAIVEEVYQNRALTSEHIATLLFTATTLTKCDERLRKLFHHRYLLRTEQPQTLAEGRKPLVYWLDKKGVEQVAINRGIDSSDIGWNPDRHKVGPEFLYHLLDTNTVQIAIRKAAEALGFSIVDRKDEETLRREHTVGSVSTAHQQESKQSTTVIPDYYFLLEKYIPEEDKSRYMRLFIEVDRRTVTGEAKVSSLSQRDFAHKVRAYLTYFHSDAYTNRYGSKAGRVLTITIGEKRAQNLRQIAEKFGGKARFWFTTLDKITPKITLTFPETILASAIWSVSSWKGLHTLTGTQQR